MADAKKLIIQLEEFEKEIFTYKSILDVLRWDELTYMPKGGSENRAKQKTFMELKIHDILTSKKFVGIIRILSKKENYSKLNALSKRKIDLYNFKIQRSLKIPKKHIKEYNQVQTKLHSLWIEARKSESFKIVIPYLKKIFDLKIQEAKYIDPKRDPYDVLIENYERDLDVRTLDKLFSELKIELIKIHQKISKSKKYKSINSVTLNSLGKFDKDVQIEICRDLCARIIGNDSTYNLSLTVHPFMIGIDINDARITTAIKEEDPYYSFGATAHECGHALYALNYDSKTANTILSGFMNVGVALDESQSRFWENIICKSEHFWAGYYKNYQSKFGSLKKISEKQFYTAINALRSSLIRIRSDELTYCIHIIIRYEIEKDILNGKIKIEDLEKIWNAKYKEYLNITPDKPSNGVLQDTQWFIGFITYFPTYAIGNIFAATMYQSLLKQHPKLNDELKNLQFDNLRKWLIENIYRYGAMKTTKQIMMDSCGKYLDITDYVNYLKNKYYKIYEL